MKFTSVNQYLKEYENMAPRHWLEQEEATCEGGVKYINRGLLPGMKVQFKTASNLNSPVRTCHLKQNLFPFFIIIINLSWSWATC
jgi:hypothetical protein